MKTHIKIYTLTLAAAAFLVCINTAQSQNIHTAPVYSAPQEYADLAGMTFRSLASTDDGSFTGILTKYYENEAISEQGQFVQGKKEGIWNEYNQKGAKLSQAQFKNGLKHGEWIIWNGEGQVLYHMFYNQGQRIGTWKIWNDEGVLIEERTY